jgi:RNA polymerase sigma factor (sigma-70 family)
MDCKEITNSQILVACFNEGNEVTLNRIFRCFFNLFFEDFKRLTYRFCQNKIQTKYKEDELARDAFSDGLMSFYYKLKNDGFEEKGAQIKTAFFSFCIFKLKGLTKTMGRRFSKETVTDFALQVNRADEIQTDESANEQYYELLLNMKEEILLMALQELGQRGSDLITWKKIHKLSNEEIAGRMNIQPGTVPNEVYKAFNKLKEIVHTIQKEIK